MNFFQKICGSALLLVTLAACTPSIKEVSKPAQLTMPKELEDCKSFEYNPDGNRIYFVMRCPNSTTTTVAHVKGSTTAVVIDGLNIK